MISNIGSKKIRKETISMYQDIVEDTKKLIEVNESNPTEARVKILNVFRLLKEILMGSKTNKQSERDTHTDESEPSQQGQGLKILTPQQIITRLPILLAQLKAGNNSQNFKN